jgi:hypothetical protein
MNAKATRPSAAKFAYLGTWLVFVAVLLIMEGWSNAPPLYLFIWLMGFVGTLAASVWSFRNANWVYGAIGSSVALLIAYALWWAADIANRYSVDPSPGLLRTMLVQVEIWVHMARSFIGRSHFLYAFCQLYWGLLMALLQLAFLPMLLRSLRSARASPSRPAAA